MSKMACTCYRREYVVTSSRKLTCVSEPYWHWFSFSIGELQTYLQSASTRIEEMRMKRRDTEQWMAHRLLPENLKDRIIRHEQYRWQETRGVDEEGILTNLPKDLRREIKRHLCLSLLMKVTFISPFRPCCIWRCMEIDAFDTLQVLLSQIIFL